MVSDLSVFRGAVGEFIPPSREGGFGLKIARLLDPETGRKNGCFWHEARSIQRYCASVRFLAGTLKIPLAARYYIHRADPLSLFSPREREDAVSLERLFYDCLIDRDRLRPYRDYRPVPGEDLRRICDEELDADLLLVYPVAYGGETDLDSCRWETFSSEDVKGLIAQISGAILDLHRSGASHGDIKPGNIMVSEIRGKKIFRLTDFGSAHFENVPSDTGSEFFFNRELYDRILKETGSALTARVHTDFYALGRTVLVLALGYLPGKAERCLMNEDLVPEKWPGVAGLWEILRQADRLKMEDLRKLAAEASAVPDPGWRPIGSYCDEFDVLLREGSALEYGKLHEQICFFEDFDPLMRIRGIRTDMEVRKLFPEFYHTPLSVSHCGVIFHAPDDVRTGEPPRNFHGYTPRSLRHAPLSAAEAKRLTGYGKKLNGYFRGRPGARACLPGEDDIFRCNGILKLLWGRKPELSKPVDYEAYFRYLAGGEAKFSIEDWLTLLPRRPELGDKLDRDTCLELLDRFIRGASIGWLFGCESFLRHISAEKFDFDAGQWLRVCKYTDRFNGRIDRATAWEMLRRADGREAKLLRGSPHIAELLCAAPSPAEAKELYFKDFLALHKWDRETFLMYFPGGASADLSARQWKTCLLINPELADLAPEEILSQLDRKTWVRILGSAPERIAKCPCIGRFSSAEWESLLLQQPVLKKYCPAAIVLSDRWKRRFGKRA